MKGDLRGALSFMFGVDKDSLMFSEELTTCDIGKFIGSGEYSAAIDIDWVFLNKIEELKGFKDPVLIISREVEKPFLVESIGNPVWVPDFEKAREEAFKEWKEENQEYIDSGEMEENDFSWSEWASEFDILPYLEMISEEYGVIMFFTEKVEEYVVDPLILEACNKFLDMEVPELTRISILEGISEEWIAEGEDEEEVFKELNLPKSKREEVLNLWKIIVRDLKKMSWTILDNFGDYLVSLDLHDKQFVKVGDEIVLLDGFVINN